VKSPICGPDWLACFQTAIWGQEWRPEAPWKPGHAQWAIWVGIFLVSTVLPAVAQDAEPGWRHGSYGMMGDGSWVWMMIFGPLMMILFVAAVVILVAFALRWLTGHGTHASAPPGRTPLDILKERFARGEIDKAEYEERRRVLGE
jgi:putative membrane protein